MWGESSTWMGVYGVSHSTTGGAGMMGENQTGAGVIGRSHAEYAAGVEAENVSTAATAGPGVRGKSAGTGVWGESTTWVGVFGHSVSTTGGAGVWGENPNGTGVFGKGVNAGVFEGDVIVTGDLRLTGADVAEQFDVATEVPAGSVVCLDDAARVEVCRRPYDRRVAGIVSGLGDRKPAVVLDRADRGPRRPVAVVGKAWCLADAENTPIEVGDLLTTSGRPGHAMAARDPGAAFGAVIGKALSPLSTGRGMVLVLVGLG
ncbi:hypothetical protein ND748_19700 [Frankia sp. AiPs1]|uniref:hypothetical protein n=1 Tax=Frankia sp. AiPs1 TaxID=573493 RepID=UPI002044423E|nr:hypothetical protein [Frankia sp. AiPs1]MCM3923884.1 hypothetical protein [Frankia sp. AiPs1]